MNIFIYCLPILALVLLMFTLLVITFYCRLKLVINKKITPVQLVNKDFDDTPAYITLLGYSYDNQFQQPVLFIMLNLLILMFGLENLSL